MTPVTRTHVYLDDEGRAWIDDTNVKVLEVVLDKVAYGWSAEEIHVQHDRYLSLAQIDAALAYYYDHQAEFDDQIERDDREVELLRQQSLDSPVRQKLRAKGLNL